VGLRKSYKRKISDVIEKIFKTRIVRPQNVGLIYEEVYLKRLFSQYQIDCVLDVGANQGQYVDMLRNRVGYKGLIISFEPTPNLASALKKRAKQVDNWVIMDFALANKKSVLEFNIMESGLFNSLLSPEQGDDIPEAISSVNKVSETIPVQADTLANIYYDLKGRYCFSRPYLKMDTQGNDLNILNGARGVLSNFIGVQTELAIRPLYKTAPPYTKVIGWLEENQYSLSAFVPNNQGHFPLLVEVDGIFINNGYVGAN
jgi:FkbM family methyltransferase